jgi:flagellar basal-body rod protein FlgC
MIEILPGVRTTTSALNAERMRMEVVSQNIAHANTTRGADGKPYQAQKVIFESMLENARQAGGATPQSVVVSRIETQMRPPRLVYEPGHPEADGEGMVAMPDINVHEEMVELIAASRAFEANLAVLKNARNLAAQTLSIGKRS